MEPPAHGGPVPPWRRLGSFLSDVLAVRMSTETVMDNGPGLELKRKDADNGSADAKRPKEDTASGPAKEEVEICGGSFVAVIMRQIAPLLDDLQTLGELVEHVDTLLIQYIDRAGPNSLGVGKIASDCNNANITVIVNDDRTAKETNFTYIKGIRLSSAKASRVRGAIDDVYVKHQFKQGSDGSWTLDIPIPLSNEFLMISPVPNIYEDRVIDSSVFKTGSSVSSYATHIKKVTEGQVGKKTNILGSICVRFRGAKESNESNKVLAERMLPNIVTLVTTYMAMHSELVLLVAFCSGVFFNIVSFLCCRLDFDSIGAMITKKHLADMDSWEGITPRERVHRLLCDVILELFELWNKYSNTVRDALDTARKDASGLVKQQLDTLTYDIPQAWYSLLPAGDG